MKFSVIGHSTVKIEDKEVICIDLAEKKDLVRIKNKIEIFFKNLFKEMNLYNKKIR